MTAPTIETEHLILRAFRPEDADAYYKAILSDPVALRALPTGRPVPQQRTRSILDSYIDHWDEYGYGLWAVVYREDDTLIGHCGLQKLGNTENIEFTYAITYAYVSGNLPMQAGHAALRYAFGTLRIPEVFAVILPENGAARRVYSRLGMRPGPTLHVYEQRLSSYSILQGDFYPDESHYVIKKDSL